MLYSKHQILLWTCFLLVLLLYVLDKIYRDYASQSQFLSYCLPGARAVSSSRVCFRACLMDEGFGGRLPPFFWQCLLAYPRLLQNRLLLFPWEMVTAGCKLNWQSPCGLVGCFCPSRWTELQNSLVFFSSLHEAAVWLAHLITKYIFAGAVFQQKHISGLSCSAISTVPKTQAVFPKVLTQPSSNTLLGHTAVPPKLLYSNCSEPVGSTIKLG